MRLFQREFRIRLAILIAALLSCTLVYIKRASEYQRTCTHTGDYMIWTGERPVDMESFAKYSDQIRDPCCQPRKGMCIFSIKLRMAGLEMSPSFSSQALSWFGNNTALLNMMRQQHVILVRNHWTYESVVFNLLRSRRPLPQQGSENLYINDVISKSLPSCDFCTPNRSTASDSLGYMSSKSSTIVSNAFKLSEYHGLLLFKTHNPLTVTQDQLWDGLNLAQEWFRKVAVVKPIMVPHLFWDILPKASASQVHPHIHLLPYENYFGRWQMWSMGGANYHLRSQRDLIRDIIMAHADLGLTVHKGESAVAFPYLAAQNDREVIVVDQTLTQDFVSLLHKTMEVFITKLGVFAISMGIVLNPIGESSSTGQYTNLGVMARIVSRGPVSTYRGDISSFDLFGLPNVNSDPFELARLLQSDD